MDYQAAGDFRSAILSLMDRQQKLGPQPYVYYQLAQLYRSALQEVKPALDQMKRCIQEFPGFMAGYALLGDLLLSLNQFDRAVRYLAHAVNNYESALLTLPSMPSQDLAEYVYARANLGLVCCYQKRYAKAEECFRILQGWLEEGIIGYSLAPQGYALGFLSWAITLKEAGRPADALAVARYMGGLYQAQPEHDPLETAYYTSLQQLQGALESQEN